MIPYRLAFVSLLLSALLILEARATPAIIDHEVYGKIRQKNRPRATESLPSSVTLLFQNNLNSSDNVNHVGALLYRSATSSEASAVCELFHETLLSPDVIRANEQDFLHALSYETYAERSSSNQSYQIGANQTLTVIDGQKLDFAFQQEPINHPMPILCTQSSTDSEPRFSSATDDNQVAVTGVRNTTFIGFRNLKSFRFLGIPYTQRPDRFTYSTANELSNMVLNATEYGTACEDSEDCLFLNIQTPYLPLSSRTKDLRPVVLWIHGGAFTSGAGSDSDYDGGNLASREDLVVVTINYRLGSFGFFAVPNTTARGNYGISDQLSAIQWTLNNIGTFGGNPEKLTIMGQSAGAQSVRAILSSPLANDTFAAAIVLSNVGPMSLTAAPTPDYQTIEQAYSNNDGGKILSSAGCNQTDLQDAVDCLATVNRTLVESVSTANALVQDGYYINSPQLNVGLENNAGTVANVPVIFGNVENDAASFMGYPSADLTNVTAALESVLAINTSFAQSLIDSNLFTANNQNITEQAYNISQMVITDLAFRCNNQATVHAGVKTGAFHNNSFYYQFTRTSGGLDFGQIPGAPVEPGYPDGDPELPYYKFHASEFPWVFGNQVILRDDNDLYAQQVDVSYFASFIKNYDPNADHSYLMIRGYDTVMSGLESIGSWKPVGNDTGSVAILDYPPRQSDTYLSQSQCDFVGVPIDYYLS